MCVCFARKVQIPSCDGLVVLRFPLWVKRGGRSGLHSLERGRKVYLLADLGSVLQKSC